MPHYMIIHVPIHYENAIKKMKEEEHHICLPKLWKIAAGKAQLCWLYLHKSLTAEKHNLQDKRGIRCDDTSVALSALLYQ